MHNTSTKYKQAHNQTMSWNDNRTLIFVCLVGRFLLEPLASSSSAFTTTSFLIQMLRWIRGSSWVEYFWIKIHIPYHLRNIIFLVWIMRALSSVDPIFSSLVMSQASSCVHSSQSLLKVIKFLLAHIPRMNESHDPGRPFKVVITISYSSSIASS